jgi:beta-lactam-binding protein with PASTA domain
VTLVLAKPLHGTVPRVLGRRWPAAGATLRRLKLRVTVRAARGAPGRVLSQTPAPGVAAAPGMRVTVTVGHGG